jgi:hypothetical protein
MIRLHVTAEGQTEQAFVKSVLAPHLAQFDVFADARCVLTSKDNRAAKEYRGGMTNYIKAKNDIQQWIKEDKDPNSHFTTMFDLYALPDDFPCFKEAKKKPDPYQCVAILEGALLTDLESRRFTPYIQLHEFEALILVDPQHLDWEYLDHGTPIKNLIKMVGQQNPELINDGPTTAPSKRILAEIPEYGKGRSAVSVVSKIGLPKLREKCAHFDDWIRRLEALKPIQQGHSV